jgi:predicted lipoprotein with Yx(FWY)xxD motif
MKIITAKNIGLTLLLLSGITSGAVNAADGLLTAKNGMTLYTFDKDKANSGKSACLNECITLWPAVPVAEASTSAAEYGSLVRADGFKQLTFRGQPVYFFGGDKKPGQANGDKLGGVWHVIPGIAKSAQSNNNTNPDY